MSAVAAIVLAAGRSTRMGGPNKLLALLEGKPLVRHAVEAALASPARPVIVVTGHQGEAVRAALAGAAVTVVRNPAFAEGLATSLQAGIRALPDGAEAAVVLLGDMPRVSAPLVARLIAAFAAQPQAGAVVPVHAGRRANPVLIARALFPDVLRLAGDEGARRLLAARADVVEVPTDDLAVTLDVDTPEALAALTGGPGGQ